MNPFDWQGPQFLLLYCGLFVATLFAASVVRHMLRVPADVPQEAPRLSPYQVAFLSGGPWLAFAAALTRLVKTGQVIENSGAFTRVEGTSTSGQTLERRLLRSAAAPTDLLTLFARARLSLAGLRKSLQKLGLILTDAAEWRARWVPALLLALLALFGFVKVLVGMQRERGVTFLIIGVIITLVAAGTFLFSRLMRTQRGDAILAQLQRENAALGDTLRTSPDQLAGPDLALGVALFGIAALSTGQFAGLTQHLAVTRGAANGTGCGGGGCSSGWTCAAGSGCGGGSSCGGGSGCGGGGGCGGCGGGGGD